MSIEQATLDGRTAAEARMVDACTITRGGTANTFDPGTGGYTVAVTFTVYTGPCEVQISDGLTSPTSEAGGSVVTFRRLTVKVPISVEGASVDDIVTITASMLDPELVGKTFRVTSGHSKTYATARRLQADEVILG